MVLMSMIFQFYSVKKKKSIAINIKIWETHNKLMQSDTNIITSQRKMYLFQIIV